MVISGSGISKDSGIPTFRDTDGLWNGYNIESVASINAWNTNPSSVNDFYNERRINVLNSDPNQAHLFLSQMDDDYNITIFTQNIDDLHERAGSLNVVHMHGEILKAKSFNPQLNDKIDVGYRGLCEYRDVDSEGNPLRPDVVFFGEKVNNIDSFIYELSYSDIVIVVGTSLSVSPVNTFSSYLTDQKVYLIDPNANKINAELNEDFICINESAYDGLVEVFKLIDK